MGGIEDSLEQIREELIALEEYSLKEKRIKAVTKIVRTAPEDRTKLDTETLFYSGACERKTPEQAKADAEKGQAQREIGDITV